MLVPHMLNQPKQEGQGTVVDCAFSIIRSVSGSFGKILESLSIEFRVEIDLEEKESMIE